VVALVVPKAVKTEMQVALAVEPLGAHLLALRGLEILHQHRQHKVLTDL
jgi:hypothetical protein